MNSKHKKPSEQEASKVYRQYNYGTMIEAARMVREDKVSIYNASKEKGVPWSSLKRFLSENEANNGAAGLKKLGRPFALDVELENKLFNYIIKMQELGFGLTVKQLRVIAYELAETSGRETFFNKQNKCASKNWWSRFKQRYGLTLRVPENLSAYRASMANPVMIGDFFHKLSDAINKLQLPPHAKLENHLWNVDETGLMFVVKSGKVVTEIGKRFVYKRSYAERGETMTLVGCICANGSWIPPFIIFKGSRWNDDFKKDCLPDTQVHLSERGWITKELFLQWFQFFLDSNQTRPVLLLMDSHSSHISPEVIELARQNEIHILTFPSHTTHVLQPLDVGVYKALKSSWRDEINSYMVQHPTQKPNKRNFHSIFKIPFLKALSEKNIKNSFKSCGIVPFDPSAIPREKLVPSTLTDCPDPQEAVHVTDIGLPSSLPNNCGSMGCEKSPSSDNTDGNMPTMSPVDHVLKIPTTNRQKKQTRGRKVDSRAKLVTENQPDISSVTPPRSIKEKKDSISNLPGPSGILKQKQQTSSRPKQRAVQEEEWTCGTCKELFSNDAKRKNGKKWIQCSFCLTPYHELCQSEPVSLSDFVYMCDFCSSKDDE